MEGILERAVEVGIDTLRRQLSGVMPDDMLLVAGDGPQARGFRLDGYGVFFDVEVPAVRPSLAWSLRTMNETAALFLEGCRRCASGFASPLPTRRRVRSSNEDLHASSSRLRRSRPLAPPRPIPAPWQPRRPSRHRRRRLAPR